MRHYRRAISVSPEQEMQNLRKLKEIKFHDIFKTFGMDSTCCMKQIETVKFQFWNFHLKKWKKRSISLFSHSLKVVTGRIRNPYKILNFHVMSFCIFAEEPIILHSPAPPPRDKHRTRFSPLGISLIVAVQLRPNQIEPPPSRPPPLLGVVIGLPPRPGSRSQPPTPDAVNCLPKASRN